MRPVALLERQDAPALHAFGTLPFVQSADFRFKVLAPQTSRPSLAANTLAAGNDNSNTVTVDRDDWKAIHVVNPTVWQSDSPEFFARSHTVTHGRPAFVKLGEWFRNNAPRVRP